MSQLYAVFDTNVLVSALMSSRDNSPTVVLLDHVLDGRIVLLYNSEIEAEYEDVLRREKFSFDESRIQAVLSLVRTGLCLGRTQSSEVFTDADDAVFYEVALSKEGAYIVTGNLRHFPKSSIVVTPAEMIRIVEGQEQ